MSLSKHQLAGKLSKKTLLHDEKVQFLYFAKCNPNFGCRKLAEIYKIGKTAAANILKEEKSIRSQHELFREKSKKHNRPGNNQKINDILVVSEMFCFENLSKWPNVQRRSNDDQRKS